ncbi:hypothetical protein SCG7109_AB_00290 [Chlamydiales bacterium SCGC AG-110-M15]|nr:hypothetical protein SCG7109_AB_00290 [Chlamydiales bacterium SCGC AG-110-M15]
MSFFLVLIYLLTSLSKKAAQECLTPKKRGPLTLPPISLKI